MAPRHHQEHFQKSALEDRPDTFPDDQATASTALATVDYLSGLLTASEFDVNQLLDEAVRVTAEHMKLKASAIRLIDPSSGELVVHAVYGLSDWFLSEGPRYGMESRFRRLIDNGGVLQVENVAHEPDLRFSEAALREGIHALLAVGLVADGALIGALSVYSAEPHRFTQTQIESMRAIANQVSVAIELARLHKVQGEKGRLERDLELAGEIQKRVLPADAPKIPGFTVACHYEPWEQVGGDFYDFIELPLGNVGIVVGDVSGKGIWASLLSFVARTAVRAHAEHEYSIGEIVARVNQTLYEDTKAEQFATLAYGVLNVADKMFTYVTALCPPPLLVRNGKITELDTDGLAVGVLPNQKYRQSFFRFAPGDLLVMYSDGYSEVFNEDGEMFGDERVARCILKNAQQAPRRLIEELEAEIESFLDGSDHGDDRTIVVVAADH
ncbi:MAG: SpoIIE family protein phosphatase [Candidatus Latescibacterota bacterium]|jgi:sigma-B regulation protein RsbU (phosphoserine phosphatase)